MGKEDCRRFSLYGRIDPANCILFFSEDVIRFNTLLHISNGSRKKKIFKIYYMCVPYKAIILVPPNVLGP